MKLSAGKENNVLTHGGVKITVTAASL